MSFYRFSEIEDENSNVREVLGRVFYDSKLSLLQTLADEEIFECLIIIVESIDKILEKLSNCSIFYRSTW